MRTAEDVAFQRLDLELLGISKWKDRTVSTKPAIRRTIEHYDRFLELEQPNTASEQVLRAGARCQVPFDFVVPDKLLDRKCRHEGELHDQHTHLPPTLGDCDGGDQRAGETSIRYRVTARIWRVPDTYNDRSATLMAIKSVKVHLIPITPTPLPTYRSDQDKFILHQNVVEGKKVQGRRDKLTMSANQQPRLVSWQRKGTNEDGDQLSHCQLHYVSMDRPH